MRTRKGSPDLADLIAAITEIEKKVLAFPSLGPAARIKIERIFNYAYAEAAEFILQ